MKDWFRKAWKWILGVLSIIGVILIYILLSKSDAEQKVEKLEKEIDDIEKDIKVKEKEREKLLDDAENHAEKGAEIDKQIEDAKSKHRDLTEKRKKMKEIFAKYGS